MHLISCSVWLLSFNTTSDVEEPDVVRCGCILCTVCHSLFQCAKMISERTIATKQEREETRHEIPKVDFGTDATKLTRPDDCPDGAGSLLYCPALLSTGHSLPDRSEVAVMIFTLHFNPVHVQCRRHLY
jgi:hypothetical protein